MSFTDPANPQQPYESPAQPGAKPSKSARQPPSPARLASAIAWAVVVLIAGSGLTSYCVLRFGERGLFAVWPVGWAGGLVAAKILRGKSKLVGGLLVVACFGITLIAEVVWIHANIKGADESWFKAISLLPAFVRQFQISAFLAVVLAIFGAIAAWRGVAERYIRVRVDD